MFWTARKRKKEDKQKSIKIYLSTDSSMPLPHLLSFISFFLHSFIDIAIKYTRQEEKTNIHLLISHPHVCWELKETQKSTLTHYSPQSKFLCFTNPWIITVHILEYWYGNIHVFNTLKCSFCHYLKGIDCQKEKKKKQKERKNNNCVIYLHLFCNGQEQLWFYTMGISRQRHVTMHH